MLVGACCCTSFEAVASDLDIHIVNDYFVAYVVDDDDSVTAVLVPTRSIGMLQTCLLLIASSLYMYRRLLRLSVCAQGI